jgi:hypothetical protein
VREILLDRVPSILVFFALFALLFQSSLDESFLTFSGLFAFRMLLASLVSLASAFHDLALVLTDLALSGVNSGLDL